MKTLGTDHHKEVEGGGTPGHITGRHGKNVFYQESRKIEALGHVGIEVVACGGICEVDAASRLR